MMKILRSSLSLALIMTSSISFASTANFYLLNSASSVTNPIIITGAYFEYSHQVFLKTRNFSDPVCNGQNVLNYDPSVKLGTETMVSFNLDLPDTCYQYSTPMHVEFYVKFVDGKGINGNCVSQVEIKNPNQTVLSSQAIEITETTDHFFCSYLVGKQ